MSSSWSAFLAWRERRRLDAALAASELRADRPGAAIALLAPWGVSDALLGELARRALALEARLQPPGWLLFSALAPAERLPPPGAELAEHAAFWAQRLALQERCRQLGEGPEAPDRLAWALEELSFAAEECRRRHRLPWRDRIWREDPERDARAASLWRQALLGPPLAVRRRPRLTRALLSRPLARAYAQQATAAGGREALPPAAELEVSLFWRLFLPPKDHRVAPTLVDLALRVLETGGAGPVDALIRGLPESGLGGLAACATGRGHAPVTAELVYPGLQRPTGRATALWAELLADRGALERGLDIHTALRLLWSWTRDRHAWSPDPSWGVIQANRGRARARLRAHLATLPVEELSRRLGELPALWRRTRAAARWLGSDLARAERARGYSLAFDLPPLPPCRPAPPPPEPLGASAMPALICWTRLVALRDRWAALDAWARGGHGAGDGTWGRLLQAVPGGLTDQGARAPGPVTYDRLRLLVRARWAELEQDLRAWLATLPRRHTRSSSGHLWIEALRLAWHPEVPFPADSPPQLIHRLRSIAAKMKENV